MVTGPEPARPAAGQDVAAPYWLTELLRAQPAPVDWRRAVRAVLAMTVPIGLGFALRQPGIGALGALGALCGTVSSISGPYRNRARRQMQAVLAGALGMFVGDLVGGLGWWATAVVVGGAAVSALVSAAGNNASLAGLQLVVYLILGTHESSLVPPLPAVGWFLLGAGWTLLLSLAAWPVRATAPERRLVAAVYDGLTDLLEQSGTAEARPVRRQLTARLNAAYDALLVARSRLQGRDETYRRLFVVLTETTPVVEATMALVNARHRPPRPVVEAVAAVGRAIRGDDPPPELDLPDSGSPGVLALEEGLRQVTEVMAEHRSAGRAAVAPDRRRPVLSRRERRQAWFDQVLAGPASWLHALQLALCITLAEGLAAVLHLDRSYWVPLTVAMILKPDFGSVFGRAVLRGGGTALGALLGAALLVASPNGWVLVGLVAVIAFLMPITQPRNYGMFSVVLTPLVLILLELGNVTGWSLVVDRLVDTLVACAVVLVFGYLLWPGSRAPRIGGRLADTVDAVARYADLALRADPRGRSTLRRRTYRQLSDLRAQLQRVLVEPSAAGRQAAAWYPAMVGLERLAGSVTRVAVEMDHGAPVPAGAEADAVVAALREVAAAVREQRAPAGPPVLADPALRSIAADLDLVVSGLRGPDVQSVRPFDLVRRLLPRVRRH